MFPVSFTCLSITDRPRDSISSSGGSDSGDAPDGSSSIADEDLSVSTDYAKLMSDNSIEKNFKLAIDSYSKVCSLYT